MKRWLKYKAAKLVDMGVRVLLLPLSTITAATFLIHSFLGKFLFIVPDHLGDAVMSTSTILL
jgi:hypothetical protein